MFREGIVRRISRLLAVVPAIVLTMGMAAPSVRSVPLPDDFSPEGIAAGTGRTVYVGSLRDGDIYRADLRTGKGARFIDAPAGRVAGGLKFEQARHRLWVAGGPTAHAVEAGQTVKLTMRPDRGLRRTRRTPPRRLRR